MRQRAVGSPLRAAILTAIALAVTVLTWRLRPSAPTSAGDADADVVLGCAWLAWLLAGYLAIAIAATSLAHVVAAADVAAGALNHLAPAGLRRLVDSALTVGVVAAVLSSSTGTAAVAATTRHGNPVGTSTREVAGSALDWPGLQAPARPAHHHPPVQRRRVEPVVVQPGDSLWTIAADHLRPGASRAAITTAWHQWYAANRPTVGSNPNLLYPGQRLLPPEAQTTSEPRSTR